MQGEKEMKGKVSTQCRPSVDPVSTPVSTQCRHHNAGTGGGDRHTDIHTYGQTDQPTRVPYATYMELKIQYNATYKCNTSTQLLVRII